MLTYAEINEKAEREKARKWREYHEWRSDELWNDPATWEYETGEYVSRPTEDAACRRNYLRMLVRMKALTAVAVQALREVVEEDHLKRHGEPLRDKHERQGVTVESVTGRDGTVTRALVEIDKDG